MTKRMLCGLFCILMMAGCESENPADSEGTESVYYVAVEGDDGNPGTAEAPWASLQFAVNQLEAGSILMIQKGRYDLTDLVRIQKQGREDAWFTLQGESQSDVILDGSRANFYSGSEYPYNNGLLQVEGASYIRIRDLTVQNSHRSGINIQDSQHIDVINCRTENSLSPGIAAWQNCRFINVLGNTVINASDMSMSWEPYTGSEAPHEAISMAGPHFFEVAWNHVYNCQKEGIDVKETAAHGEVHHNYVHDCQRQGLYIDGWFGVLEDIVMNHNVVHGCEAGIAVSSENGPSTRNLKIHHNLVYDNRATGIFFSRWGEDNARQNIEVYNNTFYRNGYGPNLAGWEQYWLTGGCYLYSTQLENVHIHDNIFAKNKPFEIGYSGDYEFSDFGFKGIVIEHNLIQDINTVEYPFFMETWTKDSVHVTTGAFAVEADPMFENPDGGDFRLNGGSPAAEAGTDGADIGAFEAGASADDFWWLSDFPPVIDESYF